MLGRLSRTAPALALALLLCGCSVFASDPPPLDIASDQAARSLKDTWAPTVAQAAVMKVSAAATAKPSAQLAPAQPQDATSCKSDSDCVVILAALINDPKRRWLGQPQSAAEYANGTRFFAYRALRGRLSCRELKRAIGDTQVATTRLQAPAPAVSAAQAASALSLSAVVAAELRREIAGRCRATPVPTQAHAWWPLSEFDS